MGSYSVSTVSPPMQLGEGPHWLENDGSLLFVDYPGGTLNRIYPMSGRHQVMQLEGAGGGVGPSVVIPIEGLKDQFVVGLGHDLVSVHWSSTDPDWVVRKAIPLLSFDEDQPKNGLNDAKCDPQGRLWADWMMKDFGRKNLVTTVLNDFIFSFDCRFVPAAVMADPMAGTKGDEATPGVIEPKKGSLYRIDHNLSKSQKVKEVTISNGLTWSLDAKLFYYIDTLAFSVDVFDYDDYNGEISNRRTVLDFKEANLNDQGPDGMTIDNDGNLWVACYSGSKVICVDPTVGKVVRQVDLPSLYTTSCCFGGSDYATLYVTSATRGLTSEDMAARPDSGKTFAVTGLGIKGGPHRNFKVNAFLFRDKTSKWRLPQLNN